jgi:transposase InsO family protein
VNLERIITDNRDAYRSHAFREACAAAGLRRLRTKPYALRANGKAERFIQGAARIRLSPTFPIVTGTGRGVAPLAACLQRSSAPRRSHRQATNQHAHHEQPP